jgi:hypothetical protein
MRVRDMGARLSFISDDSEYTTLFFCDTGSEFSFRARDVCVRFAMCTLCFRRWQNSVLPSSLKGYQCSIHNTYSSSRLVPVAVVVSPVSSLPTLTELQPRIRFMHRSRYEIHYTVISRYSSPFNTGIVCMLAVSRRKYSTWITKAWEISTRFDLAMIRLPMHCCVFYATHVDRASDGSYDRPRILSCGVRIHRIVTATWLWDISALSSVVEVGCCFGDVLLGVDRVRVRQRLYLFAVCLHDCLSNPFWYGDSTLRRADVLLSTNRSRFVLIEM